MKNRVYLLIGCGATVLFLALFTAQPGAAQNTTKEVMRFKLHYAQRVLEGIAMENHEVIKDNARRLRKLSQQAEWDVRETPEYQRFTAEFARQADALAQAAERENVDAATVAYFQMTVACTSCHRYLRGAQAEGAGLQLPPVESHASTGNLENFLAETKTP